MSKGSILNLSSLKDQVYEYLRLQMKKGEIKPGSFINMDSTCAKLGISKTPMREALLQLETEGFVTILPRRGIVVNELSLQDIRNYYQIIGALESTAIISSSIRLESLDVEKMLKLNQAMKNAITKNSFDTYYGRNLEFHDIFLRLSGNRLLKQTVETMKKRLYDFPRPEGYIKEWEEASILEHQRLITYVSQGQFLEAANFIRDVHWSFNVQKKFILNYYSISGDKY
jgi:DNA-binding GntR family transcriptional regulator